MFGDGGQTTGNRRPAGRSATRRCWLGAVLLAAGLGGCSGYGQERISSLVVTPGKYEFNNCQDIENSIRGRRGRDGELEKLMADASQGVAGEFVSAIAYRAEYVQNRGELAELIKTAQRKQCTAKSPWSSQRAVF